MAIGKLYVAPDITWRSSSKLSTGSQNTATPAQKSPAGTALAHGINTVVQSNKTLNPFMACVSKEKKEELRKRLNEIDQALDLTHPSCQRTSDNKFLAEKFTLTRALFEDSVKRMNTTPTQKPNEDTHSGKQRTSTTDLWSASTSSLLSGDSGISSSSGDGENNPPPINWGSRSPKKPKMPVLTQKPPIPIKPTWKPFSSVSNAEFKDLFDTDPEQALATFNALSLDSLPEKLLKPKPDDYQLCFINDLDTDETEEETTSLSPASDDGLKTIEKETSSELTPQVIGQTLHAKEEPYKLFTLPTLNEDLRGLATMSFRDLLDLTKQQQNPQEVSILGYGREGIVFTTKKQPNVCIKRIPYKGEVPKTYFKKWRLCDISLYCDESAKQVQEQLQNEAKAFAAVYGKDSCQIIGNSLIMRALPGIPLSRSADKYKYSKEAVEKVREFTQYLKQRNMLHRDLKLDNILYDKTTGAVYPIDFGCAKFYPSPEARAAELVRLGGIEGALHRGLLVGDPKKSSVWE